MQFVHSLPSSSITVSFVLFVAIAIFGVEAASKRRRWIGPSTFFDGEVPQARRMHGFASLGSKIFVFGGWGTSGNFLNDLHRYNPETKSWAELTAVADGEPPAPRYGFGIASLDMSLYIFAGHGSTRDGLGLEFNDLHRFDPLELTWIDLTGAASGPVPKPRRGVGLTAAGSSLFAFGGCAFGVKCFNDLYRFDPASLAWTNLSSSAQGAAPSPREFHGFTTAGGSLFVLGGTNGNETFGDLHRFDTNALVWTDLTSLVAGDRPSPRMGLGMASAADKIYVFGGSHELALLWTTLRGESRSVVPNAVTFHSLAESDGALYVFGGLGSSGAVSEFHRLDLRKLEWSNPLGSVVGDVPSARLGHGLAAAGDALFLHGGSQSLTPKDSLGDLYKLDWDRMEWSELSNQTVGDSPSRRMLHGFTGAIDKLYVFGGLDCTGSFLADLHEFDTVSLAWSDLNNQSKGESPSARASMGFASVRSMLFVFGGMTSSNAAVNEMYRFDIASRLWINLTSTVTGAVPSSRFQHGFTSAQDQLYVFGGQSTTGVLLNDLYRFDPSLLRWEDITAQSSGVSPRPRCAHGFVASFEFLFVFGGVGMTGDLRSDLYQFELSALKWTSLTDEGLVISEPPKARYSFGFAHLHKKLMVCGGYSPKGALNDLMFFLGPTDVIWPQSGGVDFFIELYDWDHLELNPTRYVTLPRHLSLCNGLFPCSLTINGHGGSILRNGNGSISCLGRTGCTMLAIDAVQFVCDDITSQFALLEVQGVSLHIKSSSFTGCSAEPDGGVLEAYDEAAVTLVSVAFQDCQSLRRGGAVSIMGGSLDVLNSSFINCHAWEGGGALAVGNYQCYGEETHPTSVLISSSMFDGCSSEGPGGSLFVSGHGVNVHVDQSDFHKSMSMDAGGAISTGTGAYLHVRDSFFRNNTSDGVGGGALHAQDSQLVLSGLTCTGNNASLGGGGVLFWSGRHSPIIELWCGPGFVSESADDSMCTPSKCSPLCAPCGPGTFQTGLGRTTCSSCEAGKYSASMAATSVSTCSFCGVGTYSTVIRAENSATCSPCEAGTYSSLGSSACSLCEAGTYSTSLGLTSSDTCVKCIPGKYSNNFGANSSMACLACVPGTYSDYGISSCSACSAGKFSTTLGASSPYSCNECSPGTFASNTGSSTCYPCRYGESAEARHEDHCVGNVDSCAGTSTFEASCADGILSGFCSPLQAKSHLNIVLFLAEKALSVNLTLKIHNFSGKISIAGCSDVRCNDHKHVGFSVASKVSTYEILQVGIVSIELESFIAAPNFNWTVSWKAHVLGRTSCYPCKRGVSCTISSTSNLTARRVKRNSIQALGRYPFFEHVNDPVETQNHDPEYAVEADTKPELAIKGSFNYPNLVRAGIQYRLHPVHKGLLSKIAENHAATTEAVLDLSVDVRPVVLESYSRQMCGPDNTAAYGPCLATSFTSLYVQGLPTLDAPSHPGVSLQLVVQKMDAYNQVIASDSSSIIQTLSALSARGYHSDPSVAIEGNIVESFEQGQAVLSLTLKPTFAKIIPKDGYTQLLRIPHIYFKGIDSETQATMRTTPVPFILANGTSICPIGYVLVLSQAVVKRGRLGSCTECGAGTYSLSPLAGITPQSPSCFKCPPNATCSGGSHVDFPIGTWVKDGGIYRLIGCPPGHQLINSIGGVFSHDAQLCHACLSSEYILDSSNFRYSCQSCPIGAKCDGNTLVGLVNDSVWLADNSTGVYNLVSCPPGFQRLNNGQQNQECAMCPPSFYCVGGTAGKSACPVGTFSVAGANSFASCRSVVWVAVVVTLSMSKNDFTESIQKKFQEALAAAAGMGMGHVVIQNLVEARRSSKLKPFGRDLFYLKDSESLTWELTLADTKARETPGSEDQRQRAIRTIPGGATIQIFSKLAANDTRSAILVSRKLDATILNAELVARGLPRGSLDSIEVQSTTEEVARDFPVALIAGISAGGLVFLVLIGLSGYVLAHKLRIQSARRRFLLTFRNAQAGDVASSFHLPYELRKFYVCQQVLGRGAYGCVIKAKTKQGGQPVAIKIIVPDKGTFEERELRQLKREASVLETFTACRCEHAVHLAGTEAVHVEADLCWFVMELLVGGNLSEKLRDHGPISDLECIKVARSVLAALKVMHSEGLIHRDIKPANIMRCETSGEMLTGSGTGLTTATTSTTTVGNTGFTAAYKLVDFGTALGVDETVAKETMMTLVSNRQVGVGTQPYMSPEMFKAPDSASYPTDLWSLGVTLFELVTGSLPFIAESDLLWSSAVAGDMQAQAPDVLDRLGEDRRAMFDNNLARVIGMALEKHVEDRFQSADEMHDAVYSCLIIRGEATYSVFVSYRVASEAPLARLLFDELNHSITPAGHRVTVYWDAHRLVKGEDWEKGFATGLLNSLCFFPLLSYGATAPLAALPASKRAELVAQGWEVEPTGRERLVGGDDDLEDNLLKEFLIAGALLERRSDLDLVGEKRAEGEQGLLQQAFPILIGRQQPEGHPDYPRMGSFFHVQGGGGKYPQRPSTKTNTAVVKFLREAARLPETSLDAAAGRTVAAAVQGLTALQGCQLWSHPADLQPVDLTREQKELIGRGYAGPPVDLDGVELSLEQRERCRRGFDEEQLRMLKAQIRDKRPEFHEIIDRAVDAHEAAAEAAAAAGQEWAQSDTLMWRGKRLGSNRRLPDGWRRPASGSGSFVKNPNATATAQQALLADQAAEIPSARNSSGRNLIKGRSGGSARWSSLTNLSDVGLPNSGSAAGSYRRSSAPASCEPPASAAVPLAAIGSRSTSQREASVPGVPPRPIPPASPAVSASIGHRSNFTFGPCSEGADASILNSGTP